MRIPLLILSILLISCNSYGPDKLNTQSDKQSDSEVLFAKNNPTLVRQIINQPPEIYCGEEHHHYVDIVAKRKIDSLTNVGIGKILYYRDWITTNGYNGYGKLIWFDSKKHFQYQFNFESFKNTYGIRSIDKFVSSTNEPFSFYIENGIDTISSNPKEVEIGISHDSDHFIYSYFNGIENCFNLSGLDLMADSSHLKSQIINKLRIPSNQYYLMLKKKNRKNKL